MSISDISGLARGKEKRKVFDEWMKGDHVIVHISTSVAGVILPASLQQQSTTALKMSYLFQGETEVSDLEVTAWLKFSGQYFQCVAPWDAVWGLVNADGEEKIWHDDIPREALMTLARSKLKALGGRVFQRPNIQQPGEKQKKVSAEKNKVGSITAAPARPLEDTLEKTEAEVPESPAVTPSSNQAENRRRNFQVIRGTLDREE